MYGYSELKKKTENFCLKISLISLNYFYFAAYI